MRFPRATVQLPNVPNRASPGTGGDSGPKRPHPSQSTHYAIETLELRQFLSAGTPDPNFGNNGVLVNPSLVAAADLAVQPDGKILVASGKFIIRYTTTGAIDTTFGTAGEVKSVVGAAGLFLQSDGKILVAGAAASNNMAVARFNADGSPDTTFGSGGLEVVLPPGNEHGSAASDIAEQSDGSVILAGETFGKMSPSSQVVIARLTPAGQLDTSFGKSGFATGAGSGTLTGSVDDIAVAPDNRIVVADHSRGGNTGTAFLHRFNADGTTDPSLSRAFSATGALYFDLAIQPDGKILAVGAINATPVFERYNIDGTVDASFSYNKVLGTGPLSDLAVQPDEKILVTGVDASSMSSGFFVGRLLPGGQLDTTFGTGGHMTTPTDPGTRSSRVAVAPDGHIIVAGGSSSELVVARYMADAVVATSPPPVDPTPPAATILAAPRLRVFQKSYSFTITYHDNFALDVSTLDDNDIVVTGPNGLTAPAQFLVASSGRHDSTRVVTYAVQGPDRRWDANDDGLYTIHLQPSQVLDTSGNPVVSADVSMFHVIIPGSTPGFAFAPPTTAMARVTPMSTAITILEERNPVLA